MFIAENIAANLVYCLSVFGNDSKNKKKKSEERKKKIPPTYQKQ